MNTACQYILKIRSNVYQNVIHEDLYIYTYIYMIMILQQHLSCQKEIRKFIQI